MQEVRTIRLESRRNQYGYPDSFHTNLAKHQPRRVPNDKEYPIDPILPGEVYLSRAQKGVYCCGFTHQKTTSHSALG